jgi:two-component system NtrC family sensor kinase
VRRDRHFGHAGARPVCAEIRSTTVNRFPHASHWYSYVGIACSSVSHFNLLRREGRGKRGPCVARPPRYSRDDARPWPHERAGAMSDPAAVLAEMTRFGRALTGALRRQTVAEHTVECLQRLFSPAAVCVALTADTPARLTIAAADGWTPVGAADPLLLAVLEAHGLVRTQDPPALGVPLAAAGHTLGVLAVRGTASAVADPAAELILGAVAAQASIAFQNTRLIEILAGGKQEWEQMVDAIRPAIAIVDDRGTIRRANRAFAELVGSPVTTLTGRPWLMLLPPAWADAVGRALSGASAGEIRSDDRVFAVRAHAVAADPRTAVLLIDDITETRRLQDQLIQSEKLSAIGQLIAGVAHELNNPLASVLGFADFLAETANLPPPLVEPVRVIQHEAQRAAGIVKNLLSFARRQDQERRRLDLGPVLLRTLALLRNQLLGLHVEPKLAVDPDLPPVDGSPNQLQQVFVNVINNAAQAIATAGRPGTVEIHARRWLDGVAVDIRDDGPGIPEALLPRIFEPFFSTKAVGEGTGLGLSISQGIIREHGGRIVVQSVPGAGATFTIELPASRDAVEAARPAGTPAPAGARVLVIDDEPHILHYMRATLEAWGHHVETAGDGAEGLERASAGGFDLIVTDVRMPRLGGREFYERLRADRPEMADRVVFATGDTVRDDTQTFLERTGRPFLHKPFKLAELRSTLSAALEQARR